MNVFLKIGLISSSVILGTIARADLVIEPYFGYGMSNVKAHIKSSVAVPGGADTDSSGTELSAGARLGFKFPAAFWIAADPQFGFSGSYKQKEGDKDSSFSRTQVYADLGYDVSPVRMYLGYGLMNELKSGDTKYAGGQIYKAGLDVHMFSDVALNIEYHLNNFKDVTDPSGNKYAMTDFFDKFDEQVFIIGLSFPIGMSTSR